MPDDYDDDVKKMVYEIHGDVKKINQHLENLNGKVERHEDEIADVEKKARNNSRKINIGVGIAITVSTGVGVAMSYVSSGALG